MLVDVRIAANAQAPTLHQKLQSQFVLGILSDQILPRSASNERSYTSAPDDELCEMAE